MDSKIILGRILQKFIDVKVSKYHQYNEFGFVQLSQSSVTVSRETGADTPIQFNKLLIAIEGYQKNPGMYNEGPVALRSLGLTHITSPIYSLLHLLPEDVYCV